MTIDSSRAEDRFVLNPSRPDDYVALLNALGIAAAELTHIVHGWSLPASAAAPGSSLDAELEQAFFGPLALAQALGRQELEQPIALTFLRPTPKPGLCASRAMRGALALPVTWTLTGPYERLTPVRRRSSAPLRL